VAYTWGIGWRGVASSQSLVPFHKAGSLAEGGSLSVGGSQGLHHACAEAGCWHTSQWPARAKTAQALSGGGSPARNCLPPVPSPTSGMSTNHGLTQNQWWPLQLRYHLVGQLSELPNICMFVCPVSGVSKGIQKMHKPAHLCSVETSGLCDGLHSTHRTPSVNGVAFTLQPTPAA